MNNILKNFIVRPVGQGDSKRIWEIRNHPIVKKNSNNSEDIKFENHNSWFQKKYFSNVNNYCYVLEDKEVGVMGYCRYDFDEDEESAYIISIALDPNFHRKGLGSFLLGESLKKINPSKKVLATIQKENIASIKLFEKYNFKIYKEDNINYYLKFERNIS